MEDTRAPVAPDLERLVRSFVRYALGDADSFPHGNSVSLAIGGLVVVSVDDFSAALSNRGIWKICPADYEIYAAVSCPVNLLGPIRAAAANGKRLVYSAEYDEVICAPRRSAPLPSGRLVVLRPSMESRTCASDFALALIADDQGRLRFVDLTLSEP
jgi:hypothetical protein